MSPAPGYMSRAPRMPAHRERPLAMPLPKSVRLKNGLRLLHLPRHDLPLVHLSLVLRSGHAADPAGEPGVAFATAALVDEGAGERTALDISADLQDLGTALYISVDAETTTMTLDLLRDQLEPALAILADVLIRPHLAADELERVKAEIVSRGEDRRSDPTQSASLALSSAVYGRHPYGRPVLPLPRSVGRLRRGQVVRFFRERYSPRNALMMVAGDVILDRLEPLVQRTLGRWRRAGGAPRRARAPRPPSAGPRLIVVPREGAAETVLRVGHLLPPRRAVDPVHVQLLNTVLGGSFTSRLNMNLRERHGFTYGAGSSMTLMCEHGMLSISAQVAPEATVPALRETLRELRGLSRRAVGSRELAKARALLLEELPASAETLGGLSDAYLELALHREAMGSLNELPVRLLDATPAVLHELAGQLLRPENATLVVVGEVAQSELERAFGPAQIRDVDADLT
jgi:zinc protease